MPFYAAIIQNVAIPVLSCIHRSPQLRSAYTYLQDNFESVFRGVFSTSRCFTHSLITLYCEYLLLTGRCFPNQACSPSESNSLKGSNTQTAWDLSCTRKSSS